MSVKQIMAVAFVVLSMQMHCAGAGDNVTAFECDYGLLDYVPWANWTCDGVYQCYERLDESWWWASSASDQFRISLLLLTCLASDLDFWRLAFALPAVWIFRQAIGLFGFWYGSNSPQAWDRPDKYYVVESDCCLLTNHILDSEKAPWWKISVLGPPRKVVQSPEITDETYREIRSNSHFSNALENLIEYFHTQDCVQREEIRKLTFAKWLVLIPICLGGFVGVLIFTFLSYMSWFILIVFILGPIMLILGPILCLYYRRKGQSQNIIPHLGPVSREQSRFGQNTAQETQPFAAHASGDSDRASTKGPSTSPYRCMCCPCVKMNGGPPHAPFWLRRTHERFVDMQGKCGGTCLECTKVSVQKARQYYEHELRVNRGNCV